MKNEFETTFVGWTFIISAAMLFLGWILLPHHLGEYIQASDFGAIEPNMWFWIWMYRIHIFGWVIMGTAIIALSALTSRKPFRVVTIPAAGIIAVGVFMMALAAAFYYSYGTWGIGKTSNKSPEEIESFMEGVTMLNHYITCMVRFGRVFTGAGLVLLGYGLIKWQIVDKWLGAFTVILGAAAMAVVMFIPDHFDIYKPLFYVKVIWLFVFGLMLLRNGINLSKAEH